MHRAEVDIGSEDGAHDLGLLLVDRQGARVILRRLVAKRHNAAHPHALGLGGRDLVADALARHLALELGEGQQHVQCQAAHAGRGVEGLGDADEADPTAIEDLDHACEVGQGPGQAVNLVDDDDVDLAGLDVAEKPLERRALHGCAGEAAIVVAGRDRSPTFAGLALHIRRAGFALRIEGVERLLEAFLAALPRVKGTVETGPAHLSDRRPKKRGPFQRVPAIAVAAAERLLKS